MTVTKERPTETHPQPRPWWKRPISLAMAFVVLTAALIAAILLAGGCIHPKQQAKNGATQDDPVARGLDESLAAKPEPLPAPPRRTTK